ncbi:MAG: hypothetical protein NUW21_10975, partial [Elusimicrobia bacterium]|nr:hypothetical protein [Elusimicrobiota bacterium]
MRRLLPLVALVLAAGALTGCDEKNQPVSSEPSRPDAPREESAPARRLSGKNLMADAPATDFVGAAPEDAAHGASALFDGTRMRDGVSTAGYVPGSVPGGRRGKRLPYTADASARITDLRGAVPPLPDDYDYSRSGATPGTAKDAGRTLLGFASFQLSQKFPSVAPIMSRLGWRASPRRGSNSAHAPYRVTVHHTQGK